MWFSLILMGLLAMENPTTDFVESQIAAQGPVGQLGGTMLMPEGSSAPVVLIVPGSGPTDRDGNGPLGLNASTYKLLAEGLAARGIATVRIDKRGMFGSAGAVTDPNGVTAEDYATDVNSWISAIREQQPDTSCVWVLGHSEGGLMALLAGQDRDTETCGLILVASPGRPLGEVLRNQLEPQLAGTPLLDQALAAIAALEAGQHVDASDVDPALQPLFNPAVQDFLISTFALDPAELIAAYPKPVLILQGERDLQVSVEDARRLEAAAPASTLVLLPRTNHVLKEVDSADQTANIATYADPELPLAPGVVDAIANFILAKNP